MMLKTLLRASKCNRELTSKYVTKLSKYRTIVAVQVPITGTATSWQSSKEAIILNSTNSTFNRTGSDHSQFGVGGAWASVLVAILGIGTACSNYSCAEPESLTAQATVDDNGVPFETEQIITNWSSTHSCSPKRYFEPQTAQDVCRVLEEHHRTGKKVRPIGTGLSPNGIGMADTDVISLSALDYVEVDEARQLVTVGAGARVADVLKELRKYNLTLENFSSIQEQQMGGWTQVAAHGTGCTLPTVDEMIVRMKLATPTEGLLTLSQSSNARLFCMARVGLGALGVVTELTLRCTPSHSLQEYMYCTGEDEIEAQHYEKLQHFRHVRYMWLPYTSKVCVVVSNPTTSKDTNDTKGATATATGVQYNSNKGVAQIVADTVKESQKKAAADKVATKAMADLLISLSPAMKAAEVEKMSFSQLRDLLLDINPLDVRHIQQVNQAEAQFWALSAGERVDDSVNILGFDCGGEQWVLEVCFPIGTLAEKSGKDISFVKRLLRLIEQHELPAPSPIEQRWTAGSTSPMSPAAFTKKVYNDEQNGTNTSSSSSGTGSATGSGDDGEVFSWVGVIMYLPPAQTEEGRIAITRMFNKYTHLMRPLLEEYGAQMHWAKIEAPRGAATSGSDADLHEVRYLQKQLARKYPVDEFNQYRNALDPHRILSNDLITALFGN